MTKQDAYYRSHGTQLNIWLSYDRNADVLEQLEKQDNKRQYIIGLIRADIKENNFRKECE